MCARAANVADVGCWVGCVVKYSGIRSGWLVMMGLGVSGDWRAGVTSDWGSSLMLGGGEGAWLMYSYGSPQVPSPRRMVFGVGDLW